MKRVIRDILGVTLALTLGSMVSFAAGSGCDRHFTDADQDGLCDYCNTACQFVDADGDGLCDGCGFDRHGMGTVCRSGYADADGNGICDNCHAGRHAIGTGCAAGYVDADGDGICDNCHTDCHTGASATQSSARPAGNTSQGTVSRSSGTGHHQRGHRSHHGHCR